ncbi:MAG: ABC transporter permease [Gemmatimonadetes bacterium]|nr:ABC transporter permease [Gemmatimonadota bacterium]
MGDYNDSNRTRRVAGERSARVEVDEEIRFHLHMMTAFYVRQGMTKDDARRAAEKRFGNTDRYRKNLAHAHHRSKRRLAVLTAIGHLREDFRFAFRNARRSWGFTLGIALTIALGVGANATMYGIIDRILLAPPPHIQQPEQVKRIYVQRAFLGNTVVSSYITHPDYRDWTVAESFQSVAALARSARTLGHGEEAQRVQTVFATASLFPLLGVTPYRGRLFVPEDDVIGATPVAVLGHEFWRREFGASYDAIGQMIDLGPDRFIIVGIAPRGFTGVDLERVDVWLPLHSENDAERWEDHRGYYWIQSIARLRPGIEPGVAAAEATALHRAGRAESRNYDRDASVIVAPIMAASGPNASDAFTVARWLAGVSIIVLIIACANVANLLLAQGVHRRREIAIRLALGVSRARLVRQLLTGSLLFAMLGAVGAVAIAKLGGDLVGSVLMPNVDWSLGVVSGRVLVFTLAVAALTGLAAGLVPATQSSRGDLVSGLKDGGTGGVVRRSKTRVAFLIVQAALSVVLLVGAGLFVRSLDRVRSIDLGFDPERLYVATLQAEPGALDRTARIRMHENALERVRSLPFVEAASIVRSVPFRSSIGVRLRAEGLDSIPRLTSGGPYINIATPGYFETMDLRILRGRAFSTADVVGAPRAAVIGETMARHFWPRDDALGKCLYIGGEDPPCTEIVGIAEDMRRQAVIEEAQLLYYVPAAQNPDEWDPRGIFVRTRSEGATIRSALRSDLYASEPSLRFVTVNLIGDFIAPHLRSWRLGATMFSAFGVLALVVAAVGLYSVLSFEVAQRRAEIGVRAALGATGTSLVRWVVADGVRFVAIGIALGGAAAFFAGRAIQPLLYETSFRDPLTYGVVAATLLAVSVLASLIPAMRTTRVQPSEALRAE